MRGHVHVCRLALLSTAIGCSGLQVETEHDPNASFDDLRSYAWVEEESAGRRTVRAESERRIVDAVERELAEKGFVKAAADPDFLVGFVVIVESGADERTIYPDEKIGYVSGRTTIRTYQEGTLLLYVANPEDGQGIWQGAATETFEHPDQETINRRIDEAVHELLARFPPGQ